MPQDPQSDFNSQLDAMVGGYAPPAAPQSAAAAPKGKGPTSFFKGLLTNFAYGASQAGMKAAGLPTDLEQAQAVTQMQHSRAQTNLINEQAKQMSTMMPMPDAFGRPMVDAQGQPVMVPMAALKALGPLMGRAYGAQVGGEYGNQKQVLANQGKANVADIAAKNKMDVTQLQVAITQHKGAKYIPDMGTDGKPFYHVLNPFGEEIGRTDVSTIPSLMSKVSTTQEFKQLDDGSIVSIPKTTVTKPGIPSSVPAGVSNQIQGGAKPITDASGQPIIGKGATTSTSRTMVEAAPKVLDFINRIRPLIDAQEQQLGPAASRWSEFMAGKVGAPNADFTKLRTNTALLSTLLMRMHAGARGSEYLMKHFSDLMDSAKQSPENLRAALGEIESYANDVRNSAPLPNYGGVPNVVRQKMNSGKDLGAAPAGKAEGSSGTLPDGTRIVIRGGRIVKQ